MKITLLFALIIAGSTARSEVLLADNRGAHVSIFIDPAATAPEHTAAVDLAATLRVGDLDVRARPAFEYRESFWYPAFDADWSWRNFGNGQSSRLTREKGGRIDYKDFVHTFYPLVPREKHFAEHPEWFSLIKGKRTTDRAQLCLTNPKLRDFMVERVKAWLRESPDAGIIGEFS